VSLNSTGDVSSLTASLLGLVQPFADSASAAYNFVSASNATDQGFLGNTITASNSLFASQVTPLTLALASQIQSSTQLNIAANGFMTQSGSYLAAQSGLLSNVPTLLTNAQKVNEATLSSFQDMLLANNQQQIGFGNQALATITNIATEAGKVSMYNAQQSAYAAVNTPPPQVSGGGGSFIVTAYIQHCESNGRAVDDRFINTMRDFKDNYVYNQRPLRRWLFIYYKCAPAIVSLIEKEPHSSEIFDYLYYCYLYPAYVLIKDNQPAEAFALYSSMVKDAARIVGYDLSSFIRD
jgi:hypothetical protein